MKNCLLFHRQVRVILDSFVTPINFLPCCGTTRAPTSGAHSYSERVEPFHAEMKVTCEPAYQELTTRKGRGARGVQFAGKLISALGIINYGDQTTSTGNGNRLETPGTAGLILSLSPLHGCLCLNGRYCRILGRI